MEQSRNSLLCKAITFWVIALLLSTMFASVDIFVESKILSKWYALIGCSLISCFILFFNKRQIIVLDEVSVTISIFIGYILIRGIFVEVPIIKTLLFISFLMLYFFFKMNSSLRKDTSIMIIFVCLLQSICGILQFLGIYHISGAFRVLGSFDNPAGLAASLAIAYPIYFSLNTCRWMRYTGIITAILVFVTIMISESRAGILAIIVCSAVFLFKKNRYNLRFKRSFIIGFLLFLVTIINVLFFYKKDSASGRMLIWQNSIEMILEKPVLGYGPGAFFAKYMVCQGEYFKDNPDNAFSQLADNVSHPFNEYLLLIIEYGIIGLFILVFIILLIIRSTRKITPAILSLISVGIFACFSYPFRYAFVIVILAYCLAEVKGVKEKKINLNIITKSIILFFVLCCSFFLVKDIMFEYKWGKIVKQSRFGDYQKLMNEYNSLAKQWNGNVFYIYNYAVLLYQAQMYEQSNEVANKCLNYFNDYDLQLLMAENYLQLNNLNSAENHLVVASQMIPNRFMPLDKLFELYIKKGDVDNARFIANVIVAKEIKVNSRIVTNIKNKAKEYLDRIELTP